MTRYALVAPIAKELGIPNAEWLEALIGFESGWNPRAYNSVAGATGLLQWIPRTMKEFGFIPADVAAKIPASGAVPEAVKREASQAFLARYPTVQAQLDGPVRTYLRRYKPFPTEQSLYMAVFYPAYRNVPPQTAFPAAVQAANPNIDTVQAYVDYVRRKGGFPTAKAVGLGVAGAAAIGGIFAYFFLRRK